MTQAEKDKLVDTEDITLDGRPARIVGRMRDFAIVQPVYTPNLDGRADVEFAWDTVRHVIDNRNGNFRSC